MENMGKTIDITQEKDRFKVVTVETVYLDAEELIRNHSQMDHAVKIKEAKLDEHIEQIKKNSLKEIERIKEDLLIGEKHLEAAREIRKKQREQAKKEAKKDEQGK